jgi:hypothetical protein
LQAWWRQGYPLRLRRMQRRPRRRCSWCEARLHWPAGKTRTHDGPACRCPTPNAGQHPGHHGCQQLRRCSPLGSTTSWSQSRCRADRPSHHAGDRCTWRPARSFLLASAGMCDAKGRGVRVKTESGSGWGRRAWLPGSRFKRGMVWPCDPARGICAAERLGIPIAPQRPARQAPGGRSGLACSDRHGGGQFTAQIAFLAQASAAKALPFCGSSRSPSGTETAAEEAMEPGRKRLLWSW